jgi:rare lipoprotein A
MLQGIASWYGSVLNGHRTASGERFDMFAMTACHPTLPFGSLVRVIDTNTNKSVVVRINDRGELDKDRVIDLSYAAAKELNITRSGLAPVVLEVISLGRSRHRN